MSVRASRTRQQFFASGPTFRHMVPVLPLARLLDDGEIPSPDFGIARCETKLPLYIETIHRDRPILCRCSCGMMNVAWSRG